MVLNMKRIYLLIIVLFIAFTSLFIFYYHTPKEVFFVEILKLTEEEYNNMSVRDKKDYIKDDFASFNFTLYITRLNKIKNREVHVPNFQNLINRYDINRYWYGSWTKQDNENENFIFYKHHCIIFIRGLTNEQLKDIFKEAEVRFRWEKLNGKEYRKVYNIKENLCIRE